MPRLFVCLVLIGSVSFLPARGLRMPESDCRFEFQGYEEYLDAALLKRVRFAGCLPIEGDPPREFFLTSIPEDGSALQFEHYLDDETKLQFWVFPDNGETAFGDQTWNTLIGERILAMPERYLVTIEEPFRFDLADGPVILSQVAVQSRIRIRDQLRAQDYLVRYCLVTADEADKVLLVSMRSKPEHFAYMNALFERFLSGLFLAE